ncbi:MULTISPECIES: adenosylcobinamide-phosphate synthase CbiB [unclassified Novosphingobium]|uniref:adenosylcobinamide-phosphate synthase CbiB n=1 Tax=unclassified Novosphingobium TaxID=2644732 RepID=UPI00187DDE3C|nr:MULTISPECIES: adenosylcobinamide-phosphate synthase CbiB [unclassified Novosphingobium]MCW1384550.1 adenosylcobinamide-phosphate synthase CbiB [Novosphingobium sp. KCTC 2891]QOV96604.1 cobalamin biosynthesis protein CobD [Novosphingobium sp. ES2-1]
MAEAVVLLALALDAAIGWPDRLYRRLGHPVGGFARIIQSCERVWNRSALPPPLRRLLGVLTVVILIAIPVGMALAVQALLLKIFGSFAWIAEAVLAWPALAQRSLFDHVRPVVVALEAGDLLAARRAVAMIVGRDTAELDAAGVARAAIESLAESFCDGIAAPLFWLVAGGVPGIWAYKAINTADSLIGHREERWRAFGWAAARTDDLANLLPARIGAVILCLAGRGGWSTMWRDHGRHSSPNAGWTEAAMAGALHVRLAGPVVYDGVAHAKPWIGEGPPDATAADIRRALVIYVRACLLLGVTATAFAWRGW